MARKLEEIQYDPDILAWLNAGGERLMKDCQREDRFLKDPAPFYPFAVPAREEDKAQISGVRRGEEPTFFWFPRQHEADLVHYLEKHDITGWEIITDLEGVQNYLPESTDINEDAAHQAREVNSFFDYAPGSATAAYRQYVDKAAAIAEEQKKRVDQRYHQKIDHLLDTYAKELAENMNESYAIDALVPSVLVAGSANFPVKKKEKQNYARARNVARWYAIQEFLDKIRSTGTGGISADDADAIPKLEEKLAGRVKLQEHMKAVNAYYRKHETLDGCPELSMENVRALCDEAVWRVEGTPYLSFQLANNNAEIRRLRERIQTLTRQRDSDYFTGWEFEGGEVEVNQETNRLQVLFDSKPDESVRSELKRNGFRWSPKAGAWQRQLNDNAIRAADYIEAIWPVSGEKPSQLQRRSRNAS